MRLQTGAGRRGLVATARDVWRADGARGLWSPGIVAGCLRGLCYQARSRRRAVLTRRRASRRRETAACAAVATDPGVCVAAARGGRTWPLNPPLGVSVVVTNAGSPPLVGPAARPLLAAQARAARAQRRRRERPRRARRGRHGDGLPRRAAHVAARPRQGGAATTNDERDERHPPLTRRRTTHDARRTTNVKRRTTNDERRPALTRRSSQTLLSSSSSSQRRTSNGGRARVEAARVLGSLSRSLSRRLRFPCRGGPACAVGAISNSAMRACLL